MCRGQIVEVRTEEAIGEGSVSTAMETPQYWGYQNYGMYAKDRSRNVASMILKQIVCYREQSWKSRAAQIFWILEDDE